MLAVHDILHAPPTPPQTDSFLSRTTTTLPPIAYLDRQISAMQPLTPPEDPRDDEMHPGKPTMSTEAPHLVDWFDFTRTRSAHFIAEKTCEMICYLWYAAPSSRTASTSTTASYVDGYPTPDNSPPKSTFTHTSTSSSTSSQQQLVVNPAFVTFLQKILETTQVSQSVIVLSLHYIYRLKEKTYIVAPGGSEFRIAVAGLMMANKFLDDNTYTNKTWSEVSGIQLDEINRMEKDFLVGVDYNLYVDKATYEAWLNLLKGLVMAKERDLLRARERRRHRRRALAGLTVNGHTHTPGGRARYYRISTNGQGALSSTVMPQASRPQTSTQPRARSISPVSRSSFVPRSQLPAQHQQLPPIETHTAIRLLPSQMENQQPQAQPTYSYSRTYNYSPSPAPSSLKRTAATAFSPTSATLSHVPAKRSGVTVSEPYSAPSSVSQATLSSADQALHRQRPGISLQIPHEQPTTAPPSHSPVDGLPLQGFANMTLNSAVLPATSTSFNASSSSLSAALGPIPVEENQSRPAQIERDRTYYDVQLSTLVQPYTHSAGDQRKGAIPKNLYFYTLACSPLECALQNRSSRAPSPVSYTEQDYRMKEEVSMEQERQMALEQEREREREREREKERERERIRKARLRVHRPPPSSSVRYSDYAYMPYESSNGSTANAYASHVGSTAGNTMAYSQNRLEGRANIVSQTQSARTSPMAFTVHQGPTKHFDAVRFEVERTQMHPPYSTQRPTEMTPPNYESQQISMPQSQSSIPSQPTSLPPGQMKKVQRNPYPQFNPPTPAPSTSTSPYDLPASNTAGYNSVSQLPREISYTNHFTGNRGDSAYSGHSQKFERCCVSAYTSPVMGSGKYSPFHRGRGTAVSCQAIPNPAVDASAFVLNSTSEESAYAHGQTQQQRQIPQQFDSPGVPAAPFANAGPPGVHHLQYYSMEPTTTVCSDNRGGYRYSGHNGYGSYAYEN